MVFAKNHKISRHFVSNFIKRHGKTLLAKPGKVTSPKRSSDVMMQEGEKFIADVEPLVMRHTINKKNVFVFDETMIGDPQCRYTSLSLVVETLTCFVSVGKH